MSIFNELLPKISEISKAFTKNFNNDLKAAFECLDKFEDEFQKGRNKAREKSTKDKNQLTILQSINEDDDEPQKQPEANKSSDTTSRSSIESNSDSSQRGSKKRNKNEVDGMVSPEQDKRLKRNASVRAQSIISKQVNVNLTQKLRREKSLSKNDKQSKRKEENKENQPLLNVQIKQEKISLPSESMEIESIPSDTEIKQEKDDIAMPPPTAPVPRPRKAVQKDRSRDDGSSSDEGSKRRTTRTKKQAEAMPPPPIPSARSTRASSRATKNIDADEVSTDARPKRTRAKKKVSEVEKDTTQENEETQSDVRPKRTRAKKKASEAVQVETEKENIQENGIGSPAEKPRPKRTRKLQKDAEKNEHQTEEIQLISPKEERISQPQESSPILITKEKPKKINTTEKTIIINNTQDSQIDIQDGTEIQNGAETQNGGQEVTSHALDETKVILENCKEMDKTVVLPNGVYNHAPITPKDIAHMNETVVLEQFDSETLPAEKQNPIMDATVVIDKGTKAANITEDNSLLTDDSDVQEPTTPTKQDLPVTQPKSAVKEKVQQFEELASRVTRTKTRAMAKKEEQPESQTPPDKIVKAALSADTLQKMNNMIFNGKPPQIPSSECKPRANIPTKLISASASKISAINKAREAAEESLRSEKEDARKKKEAILEAKREMQKRKREEKMAAAAAARNAAEQTRARAALDAARERAHRQAHADRDRKERIKELERKKQELARKVAETEERRKAEEQARLQRLADEQRRAEAARKKQLEEAAAMEKEAAMMAKEIEKRQKEYLEKQKMKHRLEEKNHTPLKHLGTPSHHVMEPVYMQDGFQYLNSDEDEPSIARPVPDWSTSKSRKLQLYVQTQVSQVHVDKLFSVRVHSPDLREIFPNIDRARLKRTSSAVWRTPPGRLPAVHE